MKKLWIILMVMIFCAMTVGWSQQIFYGPIHSAEWNADINDPLIYTFVEYETGLLDSVTQEIFVVDTTTSLEYTWDISNFENVMYLGVRSKLLLNGTPVDSPWNWSHVNGALTPNPFGCMRSLPVALAPPNFRRK